MRIPVFAQKKLGRITDWFKSRDLAKRFAGAVFWSFAGAVTQKVLLLATSFLCMRIMGKKDYGKLSIVRSTIQMFILFGAVGMGSTATKFIAEFRDTKREKLTGVYSVVNLLSISFGLLTTAAVLCFAGPIADYLKDPGLVHCVQVGALLLFFSIVNSIQTGILAGLERFKEIAVVSALGGVAEFVCIILGAKSFGVMGALLGYGTGFMFMTAMNQIAIRQCRYAELHFSGRSIHLNDVRTMLLFSIPLVGSSLIVTPVMWYLQTLLVRYCSFSELGVYAAADQWKMVFLFIPSALSRIVLPLLSNLNGRNNADSYTRILKVNLLVNGGTTTAFCLLFAAAAPLVIWLYGLPLSCYPTFVLLACSTIFSSLAAVFGQAIISKSKTWIGFLFNLWWGIMLICLTRIFLSMDMKETALSLGMLLAYFFHTLFQGTYFYFAFVRQSHALKARLTILPIVLIVAFLISLVVCLDVTRSEKPIDYEDPESLWALAERTERYIVRAYPDKDSDARKEAMKALEDIALLDVSYDEKARLIRERFPEESFWTDDMKDLLKQAEEGDAEAQFLLGCFYTRWQPPRRRDPGIDFGRGSCIVKSEQLAGKWLRKAAMQGHAAAQFRLGWCYFGNEAPGSWYDRIPPGHPANKNVVWLSDRTREKIQLEAEEWIARAALNGDFDAQFFSLDVRGLSPELVEKEEQIKETVLAALREAAERGDVSALANGSYRLSDPAEAEEWRRKAAELGFVSGMLVYAANELKDDAEAQKKWRQKAFDTAMKHLDEGNAEDLYEFFRDRFHPLHLEDYLGGEDKAAFANRLTARLLDLAAQSDDYGPSRRILYRLYHQIERDEAPGFAEMDFIDVQRRFADLGSFPDQAVWANGKLNGTPEEQAEAAALLRKLAGLGYADAQVVLGQACVDGAGPIPQNRDEGVKWLRKAAEQRDREAMFILYDALKTGDIIEACGWRLKGLACQDGYDSVVEYLYNDIKYTCISLWRDLKGFCP